MASHWAVFQHWFTGSLQRKLAVRGISAVPSNRERNQQYSTGLCATETGSFICMYIYISNVFPFDISTNCNDGHFLVNVMQL